MTLTNEEMVIVLAQLTAIYQKTPCAIEEVNQHGLITMTNGTQWIFDRAEQRIRMVAD